MSYVLLNQNKLVFQKSSADETCHKNICGSQNYALQAAEYKQTSFSLIFCR